MVLADSPFDFDASAKVKIIARECSLVLGARVKKNDLGVGVPGRNDPEPVRQCGAVKAFIPDHKVVRDTRIPKQ